MLINWNCLFGAVPIYFRVRDESNLRKNIGLSGYEMLYGSVVDFLQKIWKMEQRYRRIDAGCE